MSYVFLDTNILLHYKMFDQINWRELFPDITHVVFCLQVIKEIDKHKYDHPSKKIRTRAGKISTKIDEVFEKNAGGAALGFFLPYFPHDFTDVFNSSRLDRNDQDDVFLATVLHFVKEKGLKETQVVIVSGDVGLKLKAHSFKIQVKSLEDSYRLADEPDERDKTIHELENKLRRHTSRMPEFELWLNGNKDQVKFKKQPLLAKEVLVSRKMQEIYDQHTPFELEEESIKSFGGFTDLSTDLKEKYNRDLLLFKQEYLKYLEGDWFNNEERKSRTYVLDFELYNKGSLPANSIDIYMHFPDGFLLNCTEDIVKPLLDAPAPPYKPKSNFDFLNADPFAFRDSIGQQFRAPDFNPNAPIITKTNSYDVCFPVQSLKHGINYGLDSLTLEFESHPFSFSVDFEISCNELIDKSSGKVHLIFED